MICTLLAADIAMADHEVILVPDDRNIERSDRRHTGAKPATRHTRRSDSGFQHRRPYLTPYFGGGFGSGGDVVGRFTDNFGDTDRIRSGGGVYFEGGLLAAFDDYTHLRVTAGYETDRTDSANGGASFDRTRFDAVLLRNFGVFEVGAGVTAHVGVDYNCSINSICASDLEFDNAFGFTVEYALTSLNRWTNTGSRSDRYFSPLRSARLGLRYTGIEYNTSDSFFGDAADGNLSGDELDGSSLSLFVGFAL